MSTDINHAVQQLIGLLDETWRGGKTNGLPEGWTYYSFPEISLEQTLGDLSAEQAGRVIGNNSIAQQVQHIAFGNGVFAGWMRGESAEADWPGSWNTGEVDAATWDQLREALWSSLADLRATIAAHAADSDRRLTQAHGAIAHLVYHVGSLRSKLASL